MAPSGHMKSFSFSDSSDAKQAIKSADEQAGSSVGGGMACHETDYRADIFSFSFLKEPVCDSISASLQATHIGTGIMWSCLLAGRCGAQSRRRRRCGSASWRLQRRPLLPATAGMGPAWRSEPTAGPFSSWTPPAWPYWPSSETPMSKR